MYIVLRTIKNYIDTLDNIPFSEYYISYIEYIQDSNIEMELSHIKNSASATPLKMIHAVNSEFDRMVGDIK